MENLKGMQIKNAYNKDIFERERGVCFLFKATLWIRSCFNVCGYKPWIGGVF